MEELIGVSVQGLLQIIFLDLILSGDNAIVIAMAARNVPKDLQKRAILIGTGGAIGLRLLFAAIIVPLLKIPLIGAVGGLMLVWIAYKLLADNHDHGDNPQGGATVWSAVKTIIIADAVMSLDNVLALAGVAHEFVPIMIGVLISIPIIIWGSSFIMKAMEKFPIIIYAGAAMLAWSAGKMIVEDKIIGGFVPSTALHLAIQVILTIAVVGIGYMKNKKMKKEQAHAA
ncbi:TerC family protein [Priestia megaterium]|jgi:YjbE family integral membrane protein|uniref:Integral membrane, YjbE family protein n=2 Tax=Priestia megaterium TaxID=1404 RepID=A0A0B6AVA8_PRIM2|nr:TerC family protein [Priestia megaterium]MCJ7989779.1 TerC family protein [Priestia sp. OVS21]AJI24618.1 integral membrane, YjbE family protein [Priestia megaterium NBRC 15308 = ATCC 14581]KFN05247.1 integral membrane, YjbE family protein [Priestia megaterium]KGJ77408.1 membrane protein [Priestia megaterium NBRC 15308 = ATCC 14581]KLV31475.1 membrane protein [Priestia megaterium]